MIAFLGAPDTIVFSSAIVLMILIGVVEAIGLGASGVHLDVDGDGLLSWLGVGRIPLLVLLVAFLACFGLLGLIGQQSMLALTGATAPALLAAPAAALASLPLTRIVGRGLARIMPHDETTAIDPESLVGFSATIEIGTATQGSPARAKAMDPFGQAHFVMVEPDNPEQKFEQGDKVLLVRKTGHLFRAILDERPRYTNWIDS